MMNESIKALLLSDNEEDYVLGAELLFTEGNRPKNEEEWFQYMDLLYQTKKYKAIDIISAGDPYQSKLWIAWSKRWPLGKEEEQT